MKKTFKTLIAVGLCALALQSQAAQYHAQSFLNVQSLVLTNTLNPTNLVTAGSVQTNIVGLIFTNQNTRTIVSATDGSRVNPFKDVSLWVRNDGSPPYNIAATNTGLAQLSDATISVSWTVCRHAHLRKNGVTPIGAGSHRQRRRLDLRFNARSVHGANAVHQCSVVALAWRGWIADQTRCKHRCDGGRPCHCG